MAAVMLLPCAICGRQVRLHGDGAGGPVRAEDVRCARCAGDLADLPEEEGAQAA
jgi:hypothetical protein